MRNLQKVLFLSLLGCTLGTGCTITTTDEPFEGMGGTDNWTTTATGGSATTVASGGTNATGGTTTVVASGGTPATTTVAPVVFTAAECPVAAAAGPPATAADVHPACVTCMYDAAKACTYAVPCHNEAGCIANVWAALECIEFRFQYGGGLLFEEELFACQSGAYVGTAKPAGTETMTPPKATGNFWEGAAVSLVGGDLLTAVGASCAVECNAVPYKE